MKASLQVAAAVVLAVPAFAKPLGRTRAMVEDDLDRTCRASWHFQARREGNERELLPVTPAAAIEELVLDGAPPPGVKPARVRIGNEQFMLPGHARHRFVYPSVEETENSTTFRD
jgi:hypothetical protein